MNRVDFEQKFATFMTWFKPTTDFSPACFTSIYWVTEMFKPDYVIELGRLGGNSLKSLDICVPAAVPIASVDKYDCPIDGLSDRVRQLVFNINSHERALLLSDIERFNRILIFWDIHDNEAVKTFLTHFYPRLKQKQFCMIIHDCYVSNDVAEFATESMHVLQKYCEEKSNGFARIMLATDYGIAALEAIGFKELELFYRFFRAEHVPLYIPKIDSIEALLTESGDKKYSAENMYGTKFGALIAFANVCLRAPVKVDIQ